MSGRAQSRPHFEQFIHKNLSTELEELFGYCRFRTFKYDSINFNQSTLIG